MQIIKAIRAEERSYRPNPYTYAYNGPFYLASLSPSEIILMKNPYYFMANEIPFQEVVVYQYGSPTGALSALISGKASLDWSGLLSIPPTYIPLLPSYEKLITIPQPFGWGLYFNFKNPWLRIQQVRQAIAYVLNRTSIAEAGGVLYSPVPIPNGIPNFTYYSQFITPNLMAKLNPYPTNLIKAAQLLESVGFTQKNGIWYTPNGSEFTLRILNTNNQPDLLNMLTAISNELTAFGIPTEVVTITTISVVHQMWQTGTGYDVFFRKLGWILSRDGRLVLAIIILKRLSMEYNAVER